MHHDNYFEVSADSYFELGLKEGRLFGDYLRRSLRELRRETHLTKKLVALSRRYLDVTVKAFPNLIEELRGYARGSQVAFDELWILCIEDELSELHIDKCTSVITNGGLLVAHNEDWSEDSEESICVLKKSIKDLTVFELFYLNTLGGNSISINSHGVIQTINTLTHADRQIGIPRNIIARWLSETDAPDADFRSLEKLKRASGYNHNFTCSDGRIWNIECSAKNQVLSYPKAPFVHTNHFLTKLRHLEMNDNRCGTINRYDNAIRNSANVNTAEAAKTLVNDTSDGKLLSIFNTMTIARTIIDLETKQAYVWLKRESNKGWILYDLAFM